MSQIAEVYGSNYAQESQIERIRYAVKILANNVANRKFQLRFESATMWQGSNMKPDAIALFSQQVTSLNNLMRAKHLNKSTSQINALPYLINGPVEYFVVVDMEGPETKLYSIYLTPHEMAAM